VNPCLKKNASAAWKREPWRSSRDIAAEVELSQPSALEVLYDDQLYPYSYSWGAHLFPDDQHQHTADEFF
jgi:hypothetical protein